MRTPQCYPLPHTHATHRLRMPIGAQPIAVGAVADRLCLWALCDEVEGERERVFRVVTDGNALVQAKDRYIGTAVLVGGTMAVHVFEVSRSER